MIWAMRALWSRVEELEENPALEAVAVSPENLDPELELELDPEADDVEEVATAALAGWGLMETNPSCWSNV